MKKLSNLIFPVLLVCAFAQATAQVVIDNAPWCPAGATWIYRTFSATSNLYLKFSHEKDTLINNINAKKLGVERIEYLGPQGQGRVARRVGEEFLAERNDSIFSYNSNQNNFEFMYSFSAAVGDSFVISNYRVSCPFDANYPLADTVFVDSIVSQTYSNRSFQLIYSSFDRHYVLGTVVAKIGSLLSPFPEVNIVQRCTTSIIDGHSDFYEGLVCYSDSIRGQILFPYVVDAAGECHYIETFVSKLEFNNYYTIYPNPTGSVINILNTNNVPVSEIRIYSVNGAEMLSTTAPNITDLNVSALPAGLYMVKLSNAANEISILKFAKY